MQLKTLLNHVQKHKGFVYGRVQLLSGSLVVEIRSRRRSRPLVFLHVGEQGPFVRGRFPVK